VRVAVRPEGAEPSIVFDRNLPAGAHTVRWDGVLDSAPAPDGSYTVRVSASAALGTRRYRSVLRVDTRAPGLSAVTAARTRRATRVKFKLDEPGPAVVRFGRRARVKVAGVVGLNVVWRRVKVERVRVRSWDVAGNASAVARVRVR
jgi:FlgD Ig-like domain